ncbi:MAG: RagB/SusD family nutrient uptake outer membrane protein [Flavobacteriaceae bacterium]|nr:RagB/SusD family nutrient uptake outer membrane protein [Flavobacteriaceae bacterium]
MKKIIFKSTILLFSILYLQSCSDYLDTPAPNLSDAVYFNSDGAALNALAGAYDPLGWYEHMQVNEWAIGDVVSDDSEKGGENNADQADIYHLSIFNANPENGVIRGKWEPPYLGIGRANKLIEGIIDNENISENVKIRVIAEAKFLRGLYHFQLAKVFGGVPIVTKVLSPSEFTAPRNTLEDTYAQIEMDLKDAKDVLPRKSELQAFEIGRATWGAASALLVKVYIFQEKWVEAEALAKEIVNSSEYDLEPNYEDVFRLSHDNGIESVFDIQYANLNTGEWGDDQEGTVNTIFQGSRENGGYGFNCPTQDLFDAFAPNDPRLKATIISNEDVLWEGTPDEEVIYTDYPQNPTGYHSRKYQLPNSEKGQESEDPLNWRFIRFAEVLLWQAEAAAHNNSDWQRPLNRVRNRVGLSNTTETDGLKAVYYERRVELALEGHRYWDLVRTGRGNLMDGYSENKRYFLIPQVEINLNPNLEQNPY